MSFTLDLTQFLDHLQRADDYTDPFPDEIYIFGLRSKKPLCETYRLPIFGFTVEIQWGVRFGPKKLPKPKL